MILVPIFAAIALKMRLWWQADEPVVRYRLGMGMIAVLFFLLSFGIQGEMPPNIHWSAGQASIDIIGGGILVEGALPILGAWAGWRAYHPAAWVEKRLGLLVPTGRDRPPGVEHVIVPPAWGAAEDNPDGEASARLE